MRQVSFYGMTASAVGFGCVSLTSHWSDRTAVGVLAAAADMGVTHFDVARAYGSGDCETRLGRFLKGRRDQVTVATKFGLGALPVAAGNRWLRNAARLVLRQLPRSRQRRSVVVPATSRSAGSGFFTGACARESLHQSLQQLGTDYVDILLLHECTQADFRNEELLGVLQELVRVGKVRHFGLATASVNLPAHFTAIPAAYAVLQFESAALDANKAAMMAAPPRLAITHGVFGRLQVLSERIGQPGYLDSLGKSAGAEKLRTILQGGTTGLARLLLVDAMHANSHGIVLFSSTRRQGIRGNLADLPSAHEWADALQVFRKSCESPGP